MPRKNIRLVGGRPLIVHTLEAARNSRYLTDYLVSTDDEEIAAVAQQEGSPVLMRPPELAADTTPMLPVIQHALGQGQYEAVVVLQPTAPFRRGTDIDAALQILFKGDADSVVSVYQVEDHHPARMYRLVKDCLVPYDSEPTSRLRQELPPVYHRNGAIYACWTRLVWEQGTLLGPVMRPYIMPRERSINIDDTLDLAFANFLLSYQHRATLV